ncbi:MAG: tRNA modification GTPase TrmE [Deltaproteobacteria bacterium]|nr:tRNA modification GTPase TrmE [Deltaproteobacteria bacterium]
MEIPAETVDTICAVSTPPGEGGISIVRISGPDSRCILEKVFRPKKKRIEPLSGTLRLGYIFDPANETDIDEVLAVFMKAPGTYTREDVVEIHSHGGFAAQSSIMRVILGQGARLADPGEFTKRAFLNGRIDLIQAESVLDVIKSETDEELKYAVNYLKGRLSKKVNAFRDILKNAVAAIEASIDFPDEDIDIDFSGHLASLGKAKKDIDNLVSSYYEGRGLKSGFEVLIAGRTNVGKSSLLNAFALKERAIVTDLPGTTRDLIEETLYIKGMKVHLIDTAGIRTPENIVEEEGIRRVKEKAAQADLILWILDGSQPYSDEDQQVYDVIRQYKTVVIINKADLTRDIDLKQLISLKVKTYIEVSAKTGLGLNEAKALIFSHLLKTRRRNSLLITTIRHRNILEKVSRNIDAVMRGLENNESHAELLAFELHEALHHLGEITGETCSEDILDTIFSQFCIGK